MDILRLFFDCDEFCRVFESPARALRLSDGKRHRHRESTLSTSEVMTIVILFQSSGFRNFKTYYTRHVCAVNDQLKNICQIEHTRHRSKINFLVNLLAALIAYTYQEKKPSLNLCRDQIEALELAGF